jgi:hypothetical protein
MDETNKRNLANEMLKNQVDIDFISNDIPTDTNYVELPNQEVPNYVELQNPSNNINVNINVEGKTNVNNQKITETKNIIQNVVGNNTNSEEIKKNSQVESEQSGNRILSETEFIENYRNYFANDLLQIPQMDYVRANADIISPQNFEENGISFFTYSENTNKSPSFVNFSNMSKSMTKNIFSDVTDVLYSSQSPVQFQLGNAYNTNEYNTVNNFLEVKSSENPMGQMEESLREMSKREEAQRKEVENILKQTNYNKEVKKNNDDMLSAESKEIPSVLRGVVAPENPYSPIKKEISSLNDDKKSTINLFNIKTNNPPSWRIVLG